MSDWIRRTEHQAAIQQRDRTIRGLQAQLKALTGIARLIPTDYASELVAAYHIAYGSTPNGDSGHVKPGSRPPAHNPQAVGVVRRELAYLERRAVRNAATSAGEGSLSRAVDGLERS
jgi:hypothetical protein